MSRVLVGAAAILLGFVAGCSVTRYDAEYARAVERYRDEAPLSQLQAAPTEFADGGIAIRLPDGFVGVTSKPGATEQPPEPSRLRPGFLEGLRGYEGTCERQLTVGKASLPVSLAVWAIPVAEGSRAALEKSLLDKVRAEPAFRQAAAAWEDRTVKPAAGGPSAWRVLTLAGPQMVEAVVAGIPEHKPRPVRCELWLSADPIAETRGLLVWRVPDEAAGSLPMPADQLMETLVRTAQIGERRVNAAPAPVEDREAAAGGDDQEAALDGQNQAPVGGEDRAATGPAAGF